jgi:phytoene desaturase
MSSRVTALVIGAGIGGIAAAARLARSGYEVTVLEKNNKPGGRCDQFIREGHRFDVGPTLFLMPEIFAETFAALGERMEDHLDLCRIDPTYRIRFDDGAQLTLTSDLHALQAQLEAIEPGSFPGFLRYLEEGYKHYHVSLDRFVGRNFDGYLDYLSPRNLPLLFQLKALVKHYDNVGNYFRDPHLKAAFTFQNMYLGLSPYDAPATYSLLQYAELVQGVWFPVGGMYRVIERFEALARAQGVHLEYNTPVKQIEVESNRATGVILADGSRRRGDVIVANADLPYVYRDLLPDAAEAERLERKKYTCSAIMFYWGVDRVYPQLGMHNVFLAGDYRASFERIFRSHDLPEAPSFYVHAPARVDPTAAPPNQDTLFVLAPVGHLDDSHAQDWEALHRRARTAVLERLAEHGVSALEQHLKFEVSYTPHDWLSLYNLAKGSAFSLSHDFWQVGYLRPRNRHARYRNLYFVGGSTHPGTGLPIVLISARLTTERILKEVAAPQPTCRAKPAFAG